MLEAPLAESRAARVAPANAALWEAAAAGDGPGLVAAARAGGSLAAWDFTHGAALSALHYAAIADAVWPPPPPLAPPWRPAAAPWPPAEAHARSAVRALTRLLPPLRRSPGQWKRRSRAARRRTWRGNRA